MKFICHTAIFAILTALPVAHAVDITIDADVKGDSKRDKKAFSLKRTKSSKYGGTDFVDCNKKAGKKAGKKDGKKAEEETSKIDVSNCLVLERWGKKFPGAQEMCLGMGGVFMRAGNKGNAVESMPEFYCCFGKEMDDVYATVCSEDSLCSPVADSHSVQADINIRVPPVIEDGSMADAKWYRCPQEILEKYEDLPVETVTF